MKYISKFPRQLVHDLQNPMILGPQSCPYLPSRLEYKRVLRLGETQISDELLDKFNENGFRRTQNTAWKPECGACRACVSVRIPLDKFQRTGSYRRIMRKNTHLSLAMAENRITPEHFRLFQNYQARRHPASEMSEMTLDELARMVESSPVNSKLAEWRDVSGKLFAACLVDIGRTSISLVYSFYDPNLPDKGLGNYIILSLIEWAKNGGFSFVYLGFWVNNSPKMAYKIRFRPLEYFTHQNWREFPEINPPGRVNDSALDLE